MKVSLDCRLWQWYTYLLESVHDLTRCCEGFLLHQGKNSVIIQFSHRPWSSWPFVVAELASSCLLFENVLDCWFGHCHLPGSFFQPNDSLAHMPLLSNANSTLGVNSRPQFCFDCVFWHGDNFRKCCISESFIKPVHFLLWSVWISAVVRICCAHIWQYFLFHILQNQVHLFLMSSHCSGGWEGLCVQCLDWLTQPASVSMQLSVRKANMLDLNGVWSSLMKTFCF